MLNPYLDLKLKKSRISNYASTTCPENIGDQMNIAYNTSSLYVKMKLYNENDIIQMN